MFNPFGARYVTESFSQCQVYFFIFRSLLQTIIRKHDADIYCTKINSSKTRVSYFIYTVYIYGKKN